ncbi:alanine racemase [Anaerotignum propionicum]|uniref:Alanine racemase n=1 Tax=Anaerotignum propionicum DSM 1682 TaxID=991789 RepID=A0A0X1U790_ANAPI|nr:alanine racemase [Anaerotignum propionicum]AMJ40817.1 alanine racemase [Anaerotignum propionicum DSM 1682]SHE74151.1 alanine racemase [[Clostridium] propionicum DSM 1682] [Anaerotignum propionicum DSM 1682]
MDFIKRTWAEIDMDALAHNIKSIQSKLAAGEKVMGIVKADAYGHGDGFVARALQDAGFDWFGVSNIEEGMSLRNEGIVKPILVLGYTPVETVSIMNEKKITQALVGIDYAKALQKEAEKAGVVIDVHVKLDTGMTRVGFQADEEHFDGSLQELIEVSKMPNLHITGIFTHHAVADAYQADNPKFTEMQFTRFNKMVNALKDAGVDVGIPHCANSATTIAYPEKHLGMCRSGIITYGMLPSGECEGMIDIKPLMTLKTTVGLVKHVKGGSQLSYGRTYTAETDRVIATVPIGYADGYNRSLSNKARMLVNGHFAPVVGRVCMDQLMLDVTGIPDVKMGDEVVVFGHQGDQVLPIEELADMLGTINYELTCVVTKRVPRVFIQGGKVIGVVDHVLHQYK